MQKIKTSSLIYVAVLGLLTLFRVLQLGLWVDSATGFSKNVTDVLLYGALAVFFVFLMVYIYFDKKIQNLSENFPLTSNITKYIIFIYAFAVLVVSFVDFKSTFASIGLKSVSDLVYLAKRNPNLMVTVILTIVTCSVGILTGISCVAGLLVSIYKKQDYRLTFLPCFLMVLHTLLVLLNFFIKERTLVTISQNLLTLFFWMSALKFVFSYSKHLCLSKIGSPFSETVTFAFLTSVLGFVSAIAPLLFSTESYYSLLRGEYILMFPILILSTFVSFEFAKQKFLKN